MFTNTIKTGTSSLRNAGFGQRRHLMTFLDSGTTQQWRIVLDSTAKAQYRKLHDIMLNLDTTPKYKITVGHTLLSTPVAYGEEAGTFNRGSSHINLNVAGTAWNTSEDVAATLMHEALHAHFEGRRTGKLYPNRRWKATAREADNPSVELFREEMVVNYITYYYRGLRGKDLADIMNKVAISYAKPFNLNAKKEVEKFFAEGFNNSIFEEGLEIYQDMAGESFDGT